MPSPLRSPIFSTGRSVGSSRIRDITRALGPSWAMPDNLSSAVLARLFPDAPSGYGPSEHPAVVHGPYRAARTGPARGMEDRRFSFLSRVRNATIVEIPKVRADAC